MENTTTPHHNTEPLGKTVDRLLEDDQFSGGQRSGWEVAYVQEADPVYDEFQAALDGGTPETLVGNKKYSGDGYLVEDHGHELVVKRKKS